MDRREEILNYEHFEFVKEKGVTSIYPKKFPEAYKEAAINAMDEYMKEICLHLLEYMATLGVECYVDEGHEYVFYTRGSKNPQYLTKEQLFENFL